VRTLYQNSVANNLSKRPANFHLGAIHMCCHLGVVIWGVVIWGVVIWGVVIWCVIIRGVVIWGVVLFIYLKLHSLM
jgi:hypothetical protein